MLDAIAKSFRQLSDPYMWRIVVASFIGSLLVLSGLTGVFWWLLAHYNLFGAWVFEVLGGLLAVFLAYLLFPTVAGILTSFGLDRVMEIVEAEHYPDRPAPRRQPLWEVVWEALKLTVIIVVFNILAMFLYIPLWFLGFGMAMYYLLNGYLLGREFFEMVALRRLTPPEVKALRHRQRRRIFLAGLIIAVGFTVPILNFFMPILAACFMVHVFEGAVDAAA